MTTIASASTGSTSGNVVTVSASVQPGDYVVVQAIYASYASTPVIDVTGGLTVFQGGSTTGNTSTFGPRAASDMYHRVVDATDTGTYTLTYTRPNTAGDPWLQPVAGAIIVIRPGAGDVGSPGLYGFNNSQFIDTSSYTSWELTATTQFTLAVVASTQANRVGGCTFTYGGGYTQQMTSADTKTDPPFTDTIVGSFATLAFDQLPNYQVPSIGITASNGTGQTLIQTTLIGLPSALVVPPVLSGGFAWIVD